MPRNQAKLSAPILVLALAAVAVALAVAIFEGRGDSTASQGYIVPSADPIGVANSTPSIPKPSWPAPDSYATMGTPAGNGGNEPTAAARPAQPCRLVSRSEAAAILKGSVSVSEGMQGPSCIYTSRDSTLQVAVAIEENASPSNLRNRPDKASRVQVAGRTGWCLRYGSGSVEVPLSDGRVLDVSGPCPAAARFAALALNRV